ncbi:MAG: hypothetical protein CVV23_03190 [Ignavibacteriae bacterium HGW-Ignavibacteriae-2]|nr:MAG: hypothetical protein CVV23_03190 [Ignavibacteriae bacterium HGW-Ignavibacteriae-2]
MRVRFNELKGIKANLLHVFGRALLHIIVTVLCKTVRIELKNFTQIKSYLDTNRKFIIAFWHGTMLIPWYVFRGNSIAALVSKSKDGELLNRVLEKWKYDVVRGSSRDGGKYALEIMVNKTSQNSSVAITPDGPIGPALQMKAGAVILAHRSGLPIFFVGVNYKKSVKLNSWDKFEIPKPFSKINCVVSDAVFIPKELNRKEISDKIEDCQTLLNNLQKEALNIA